jgi:hypothetical protein
MPRLVTSPHNSLVITNPAARVKGFRSSTSNPKSPNTRPCEGHARDPRHSLMIRVRIVPSAMTTLARVTESSKRRGAALPGFR